MTDLQFERVFSKAQDLQEVKVDPQEVKEAQKALNGFDKGTKVQATTKQAAIVLNLMAMDFAGDYAESVLMQVNLYYKTNVTIIGEDKVLSNRSMNKPKKEVHKTVNDVHIKNPIIAKNKPRNKPGNRKK